MTARATLLALLAAAELVRSAGALGQDFVPVHATAFGDTEEKALQAAYYGALERALTGVAGYQAEGEVGSKFRRQFTQDFETFRDRYFMTDTDHRCVHRDDGRYLCEVEGTLKADAVQYDLRALIKQLENTNEKHLTFAVSAANAKEQRKQFVVDNLSGAFASFGHRIFMDSAANTAIAQHRVDYALGIDEVTFTNFDDSSAYDPYTKQLSGALTVRFHLSHPNSGEVVAVIPITVSANEAGSSVDILKPKLVANLSKRAADEIARQVNAAVVSHQTEN